MKRITHYHYILIILVLLSLVACQKDEGRECVSFGLRVADRYNGGDSKVYMDGNTPRFIEDESIKINGETYLIDFRSGSPAVYDVAKDGAYYAIYPASWVNGNASATPSITFPDMQKYEIDATSGEQIVENPMVAYTTEGGATLNFRNVAALANVHIKNEFGSALKIKYVALYTDDTYLCGDGTITGITGSTPSVSISSGITNVSIDCSELPTLNDGKTADVTFALPPISGVKLYVDVYMTSTDGSTKYSFTKETASGKTIGRNQMGDINVTLRPSGDDAVATCGLFWGTGVSEADPFIIMDKADLTHLKEQVAAGSSTYNDDGVYYLQTANIDLSDETDWLGIGTKTNPFVSNYDGSEAWTKLNIGDLGTVPAAGDGVGLFAFVGGGGEIKNLTAKGRVAAQGRNVYVGGIVGKVIGAFTIDNCHNEVPLYTYGNASYTNPYGGICGYIDAGSGNTVDVINCTNKANLTRYTYGTIGGICGYVNSGIVNFTSNTNTGNLSGTGTGSYYTGGICGYIAISTNSFENCINTGNLTSTSTGTGGIVGYCNGEVHITGTKTKNTGSIQGTNDVGGIVGRASKAMINETSGKTINIGSVTATNGSSTSNGAGGIIGNVNSNDTKNCIKACWNKGVVTTSGLGAGGIVGRLVQCKVNCCKNTGTVIVGNTTGSYSAAGGIVGFTYGAGTTIYINNCGVESCDLSSSDKKSNYCGGIVGYARDNVNITNCYAIVNNMYGTTSSCGIMGLITYTASVKATSVNCYTNFYAQTGTNKKPTVHTGSNGSQTTTYVYCNSNYAASPSSITGSAGYPTAYFSTSDGSATAGSFYNSNETMGDALRDYRDNVLGSANYLPWTTGTTPKLDWVGAGIFSSTD